MTEYEIIKECKQAYELLNDLLDNAELDNNTYRKNISNCLDSLGCIYGRNWYMNNELLKTHIKCPRCDEEMYISDLITYSYLCPSCDENMYYTECEVESAWWNND